MLTFLLTSFSANVIFLFQEGTTLHLDSFDFIIFQFFYDETF